MRAFIRTALTAALVLASAACSTPYIADAGADANQGADAGEDTVAPIDASPGFDAPEDAVAPPDAPDAPDAPAVTDADGDGSPAGVDCDDQNPARFPGARERCNGVDDDCNGVTDDPGACQVYFLARGAATWSAYPLDAAHDQDPAQRSPAAPSQPVRAAVDLEAPGVAYFVTDTTYHVMDLGSRGWVGSGARDALAPQMTGQAVITAYSVPASLSGAGNTTEGLTYFTPAATYFYNVDTNTRAWGYVQTGATPSDWTGADAPSYAALRWVWLDIDNAEGWVTVRPVDVCPAMTTATRTSVYAGVVDDAGVHIYEAGSCFKFVAHMPYAQFPPFQLPGAPAMADVVTAFYRGGLWLITRGGV